jgi:AcrR family transcriptional regulator
MGTVMQGLVSELATDPELARAFRERVVGLRRQEVEQVLRRGIERGELRADIDLGLVHEMLFGAVYYRLLLSGAPLNRGLAERIVDALLPALRQPARRGRLPERP